MTNLEALQQVIDMLYDKRDESTTDDDKMRYHELLVSLLSLESEIEEEGLQ